MKQYVVTCIDLNLPSNPANPTKPYLDNGWRGNSLIEVENQMITHLFYVVASEDYTVSVFTWLHSEEKRKTPLQFDSYIWVYTEIEV